MGTEAHVVVHGFGGKVSVDHARRRIEELEQLWSRFRPDSEISLLAERSGARCIVSDETFLLLERAVEAWQATAGSYDPTVGAAMIANGYDRDFGRLGGTGPLRLAAARPSPGCADVLLDPDRSIVVVPHGVCIDPGGIAKGLAADLVSAELIAAGAEGVIVNLGGDLRVRGHGPDEGRWPVAIEDLREPGQELLRLALDEGGVASSSVVRRRWDQHGERRHHVIDPRTGRPATTRLAGVTAIAADAWWAEVVATEILLDPDPERALRVRTDVAAIGIEPDGTLHVSPSLEAVVR
ncbi:MAG: FAD:protein FMN transferase [Actinomycetota bacterium]